MRKLMIKKKGTTWEVPLLKNKLAEKGVTLCANVYGETLYAPTFKDGEALAGCVETPLMFTKDGEKYKVYTINSEIKYSGDKLPLGYLGWSKSKDLDMYLDLPTSPYIDSEVLYSRKVPVPYDAIITATAVEKKGRFQPGYIVVKNLTTGEIILDTNRRHEYPPEYALKYASLHFIKHYEE